MDPTAELTKILPALRRVAADDTQLKRVAGLDSSVVTTADNQTIRGTKTFILPLRITDADGNLLHAFGTST